MKKTKIIIPALAAICLTTAATVSGTVAWFSASQNAKANVNNIAVINPEGSLSCVATASHNTSTPSTNTISMAPTAEGASTYWKLRDSSIQFDSDFKDGKVWKATNVNPDTSWSSSYSEVVKSTGYKFSETSFIAYAASWTLSLSVNGAPDDEYNISLDSTSAITGSSVNDAIFSSLRIAFVMSDSFYIWCPKKASGDVTYVNDTSILTREAAPKYAAANVIYSGGSKVLGKIKTGSSLSVTCWMWFDGTDPNCDSSQLTSGSSKACTAVLDFSAALAS